MKNLFHRLGTLEATMTTHVADDARSHDDHEDRIRKLEHLTAKVVGGAIVGSTLGAWLLSQVGGCVG